MDWMIYCIVNQERTSTRFIIIKEKPRSNEAKMVQCYLKDGEFIDEVKTLDGLLDGHAIIITD